MKTTNLKLYIPRGYERLTAAEKERICNGCGPKSKFDFVPDTVWFLDISEACNIHDYMYAVGIDEADRDDADAAFLHNMLVIVEMKTKNKWLRIMRKRRVKKYYQAVHFFGGPAFWANK